MAKNNLKDIDLSGGIEVQIPKDFKNAARKQTKENVELKDPVMKRVLYKRPNGDSRIPVYISSLNQNQLKALALLSDKSVPIGSIVNNIIELFLDDYRDNISSLKNSRKDLL